MSDQPYCGPERRHDPTTRPIRLTNLAARRAVRRQMVLRAILRQEGYTQAATLQDRLVSQALRLYRRLIVGV